MARSAKNDVLEKFRFGVSWDAPAIGTQELLTTTKIQIGLAKAGFHDVQMPKRTTNKIQYREGLDPDVHSLSAGLSTMEDIVLSRGLLPSAASAKELAAWKQLVHVSGSTDAAFDYSINKSKIPSASVDYRKDVTIWLYDRSGAIARAWILYNAFPVNYVSGSDLNASEDGEKSLEQLTLAYEDFEELDITGYTQQEVPSPTTADTPVPA